MNFDQKEIAEQILGEKVPISEKEISKETIIGGETGELPGVDSNAEQEDYLANDTTTTSGNKEVYTETQTNYEVSTRNEKTIVAAGSINKMTVSVVVNQSSLASENGTVDETLKNELLANIKTAAGFNEERNDEVSLTITSFNTDLQTEEAEYLKQERTREAVSKGLILLIVIGAFGVLIFLIKKATDSFKSSNNDVETELEVEALSLKNVEVEGMPTHEDALLIEERINKTIDTNAEDAVKAVRFMPSADEHQK